MPVDVPAGITPRYAQQYRRCGKAGCPLCAGGGHGHGPYWYAYWREAGRPRSRYLGKQPPPSLELPASSPAEVRTPEVAVPVPSAPASPTAVLPLRVRTLGGFALWRGEEPLDVGPWERRQTGALFKWLLGAPGGRLTRDVVADRFWPEAEPERGRANLRVLVHRLRRALEEGAADAGYVRYDGEVLELRPGDAAEPGWLDAATFVQAATAAVAGREAGACRAALALYGGEYLPGDAYEEWALGRREELGQLRLRLLLHLAALAEAAGEAEEAERCLHQVVESDRCHEEAALALMRLHAAVGQPGRALRVYRRLAEALQEDLELAPDEETQALACSLTARLPAAPDPPPLETAPTNLPAALSSFIGRRRELAALRALLQPAGTTGQGAAEADGAADGVTPCRLLTLTGPGGVGKTRLALRLAEDLLDAPGAFRDGVWLVELASLAEPRLAPKAVAQALGVPEEATRPLAATLAAHLKTKRLLLVLDNCEHLLSGCAPLVSSLLAACPHVQVLVTSRATMGVEGERPWPVPALSLPEADGTGVPGRLLESEAVRLFLDRARVHRPDLSVTVANAAALTRICRQVDGIPLAIELAAARVGVLSLEQIAERLGESLRLLTGGPRMAPPRQRTLRATLDWSYDLLGEGKRVLLRRLSVFAGGCTLEAAEAVCAGEGLAVEEVLDVLGGLVQHSLLQVHDAAGAARYRLLETLRQYGRERLAVGSELAVLERRHATYYLRLAEAAEPALTGTGSEQAACNARLELEHDNLRAALRWCWAHDEPDLGLRLAGSLWRFWFVQGYLSEGRAWLEDLLPAGDSSVIATSAVRAKALHGAGRFAWSRGDHEQATTYYQACLTLYRDLGDVNGMATALNGLGLVAHDQADYGRATAYYEQSVELFGAIGEQGYVANGLNNLAQVACEQGDLERAALLAERGLALWQSVGDHRGRGAALAYNTIGCIKREQGDHTQADSLLRHSLSLCQDLGDKEGIAENLEALAAVAALDGEAERAAMLLGAAEAIREALGAPLPFNERAVRDRSEAAARRLLGDDVFGHAWVRGRTLPLEQMLSLALGTPAVG